jgi:hypothetical protein
MNPLRLAFCLAAMLASVGAMAAEPERIATHPTVRGADGRLLPWTSWNSALDREMEFYAHAPLEHGYPIFVTTTFLDGAFKPITTRSDTIPATQNGMGIISYLKYFALRGKRDARMLATAVAMGDYLIAEDLTPDAGAYPRFTHSTGARGQFPQPPDSGTQSDRPYEIEPDKGGIAGYALLLLYEATGQEKYRAQVLHLAHVLAAQQRPGDASHSPWPFRADHRSGETRGPVSADMVYILRLYDRLIAHGYSDFARPRAALWHWIKRFQIPSARSDGALFAQFFEDHDNPANRNAWAPLNLARYLLEKRDAIDPDWRRDAGLLIDFVRRNFTHREFGVTLCHEQDEDHDAWGGVNSTWGAVLALYAKATGSAALAREAREALNFTLYLIDDQGRPRDLAKNPDLGGWQEDAHTDVIHNFVDAINAYPQWGDLIGPE